MLIRLDSYGAWTKDGTFLSREWQVRELEFAGATFEQESGVLTVPALTDAELETLTVTDVGVFLAAAHSAPAQIITGDIVPATEFSTQQGGNHATDGFAVAVLVPNGSTVYQANGIATYVKVEDESTNVVGNYIQVEAGVASANIFAINTVLSDGGGGFATVQMQNELDFNVGATTTVVHGLAFKGISSAQPADATCLIIDSLNITDQLYVWKYGLYTVNGAIEDVAIRLGPVGPGVANSKASQSIWLAGKDAAGTERPASLRASLNGDLLLRAGKNAGTVALQDYNGGAGTNVVEASTANVRFYPGATDIFRITSTAPTSGQTAMFLSYHNGTGGGGFSGDAWS